MPTLRHNQINNSDGWRPVADSWSYASSTTITVPSGATSIYAIGDKLKLTQTTVKYFVITGVASTTLTVNGGTDYSVANAAISAISFTHEANPVAFPAYFNYTPTWAGNAGVNPSIGNGSISGKFYTQGRMCLYYAIISMGSTTTYGSGGAVYTVSAPISAGFSGQNILAVVHDSSPWKDYHATFTPSSGWLQYDGGLYVYATTPITLASGDYIDIQGVYFF